MTRKFNIRWLLVLYDAIIFLSVDLLFSFWYLHNLNLSFEYIIAQAVLSFVCVFASRFLGDIYQQIWRYGGVQCYVKLILADACALAVNLLLELVLPVKMIAASYLIAIFCINSLCALVIRMIYRYAYLEAGTGTARRRFLGFLLRIFAGSNVEYSKDDDFNKIKIAIVGAGRVGVSLAEELMNNDASSYVPQCFVDIDGGKVNRVINGIPVLSENEATFNRLKESGVQEIVIALPNLEIDDKKRLYEYYSKSGCKIKVYDYPAMQSVGGRRHLREFDIEELLSRKPVVLRDKETYAYYKDKIVLITGGGGSIGSELCRQLAKMSPRQIIIVDIYENGAYDVQQELKIAHGDNLDIRIEIASITGRKSMSRIFEAYRPQIVINAAAHKHVPLMEHNCIEAIENNVFGTKNLVDLCEEYRAERFMMVSTDKAVNPTNVMGATKRMCEMIVKSASTTGNVKYSATRFGNVLGSAGSVIPLFKKQIAYGGPVTITDKRIIRYFMTIPEAAQLVLESGRMAKNGELFVLDMGHPVKILDLAENMINLVGAKGIEIVETGLRPGEKLYEELLVDTDKLGKTENNLIFIERESPVDSLEIECKLDILRSACDTDDEDAARNALKRVVPTYVEPQEINSVFEEKEPDVQGELVSV